MLSPSLWPPPLHMLTPGQLHSFTLSVGPYSHLTTNLLKEQVAIRAYIYKPGSQANRISKRTKRKLVGVGE